MESTLPRQIVRYLGEHEHLISFEGDDTAVGFEDWWATEGEAAFLAWKAAQPQ